VERFGSRPTAEPEPGESHGKRTISLLRVSNCAKNTQVYTALPGTTNLSGCAPS
jgi:hypothetical protein